MYILRVVIFSLDEPNLTRILTVFKENLVKYKGKRTSQDVVFIVFSSLRDGKTINVASSHRYFFFRRTKFDANNGLFKENLVKYKGKRTSQDVVFIVFPSLNTYALKTRQITSLWVQDKFLILEKSFAYPRSLKEDYPHV